MVNTISHTITRKKVGDDIVVLSSASDNDIL